MAGDTEDLKCEISPLVSYDGEESTSRKGTMELSAVFVGTTEGFNIEYSNIVVQMIGS